MQLRKSTPSWLRSFGRANLLGPAGTTAMICGSLLGSVACNTDTAPSPSGGCRLSVASVEHACYHIEGGPFREATPRSSTSWDDVSLLHTAYRVAETSTVGWVTFEPFDSGFHAFFLSGGPRAMSVEVDQGDASLTSLPTEGASCSLRSVGVAHFGRGVYPIRWSAGPGQVLVIEPVSSSNVTCEPAESGPPSYEPPAQSNPLPEAGVHSDAGTHDGADSGPTDTGGPLRDAGDDSDAGISPDAGPSADAGMCLELGESCREGASCCSGRCYSRICVEAQCRTDGFCTSDEECCLFCHMVDPPHCH